MTQRIFIVIFLALLFQGCAKIGKPTGGPKDIMPPEFIGATPENRSTGFKDDKIDIEFNEYIQLKDQNREIIVSPPMKEKPVIRIRDKSVRVTFNPDLLPATTYTINFGKSLADLNETNVLPDFEYVFSTGDHVDSLAVTGKLADAFTHKPESKESYTVMLYDHLSDSVPLVEVPKYYGKTNQFGLFSINNIHADTFRLVAIKDANNDLKYQPGLESMAFLDSMLIINPANVQRQMYIKDTVKIITGMQNEGRINRRDTTKSDTIIAPGKIINSLDVSLYYFTEESSRVFVTDRKRETPEKFTLVFNRPLFDELKMHPVNFEADSNWVLEEKSLKGDTLTFWVRDTIIARKDTFKLQLSYLTIDSSGFYVPKIDTMVLKYQVQRSGNGRRSREEEPKEEKKMVITTNVSPRTDHNLNKPVVITMDQPIGNVNSDSIILYKLEDTLFVKDRYDLQRDTGITRRYHLVNKWQEDTKYKLLITPGAFTDIYGIKNDTVEISFLTQMEDYYGKILLTFESYQYPMIVQLLDEKGSVVSEKKVSKSGLITFDYLSPGKYSFKAVYDKNNNGKWDTGNYLKHIQPEKIYLSGSPQQLRSNWDWEQTWKIIE